MLNLKKLLSLATGHGYSNPMPEACALPFGRMQRCRMAIFAPPVLWGLDTALAEQHLQFADNYHA